MQYCLIFRCLTSGDPGKQLIPARWLGVATDLSALKDSVYNYVVQVLTDLNVIHSCRNGANRKRKQRGILRHTTIDEDWNVGAV